jgi:hypothetical protein
MRLSPLALWLAIGLAYVNPGIVRAQVDSYADQIAMARRELQLAKIQFRDYWMVEYPRIRRHLDAQIRLTEAEVRTYKERIRLYRPFDRWSTGSAVSWALQDLRMCLLEAELRLRDLWAARSDLIRFRTPLWRDLELRVHDARLRVAQLESAAEDAEEAAEFTRG